MLPRSDLSISAVGRVTSPAAVESGVDARQQAFQQSLATMVGKPLQADILSKFADGSFLVKVAGANARMQLPAATQVGSQVALTLVALEPRPTFEVHAEPGTRAFAEAGPETATTTGTSTTTTTARSGDPAPAVPPRSLPAGLVDSSQGPPPTGVSAPSVGSSAHAAALLGKAPLIPASQLPQLDAATTPATLSDAAKMLSTVLASARQADGSAPTSLIGRTPLLAAPPQDPAALAGALRETLVKSGLFYESHVAEWADGERSRVELAQEPQMQRAAAAPPASTTQASDGMPDQVSAQMINLQLQTQEQARVTWQGQAWPGQTMQWDVAREAPQRGGGQAGQEQEPGWNSNVQLRFPLLGEIGARLTLRGQQLQIQIDAGDSAVGSLLREHAAALASAMEAAGLPLAALAIRDGEPQP
ncbi:MAG: flagellar hook-length control protein FliK [Massilia sp.]